MDPGVGGGDGCLMAFVGDNNGTVRVWDLAAGKQTGRPLVFPLPVHALTVTSSGRLVVGFGHELATLARREDPAPFGRQA
ncbi:hypothetical protein ABZW30_33410 [Kitasatospora sp. NPDC004669]|uniref:hypothetical protein n=1 Tax=Kitasatospora sp. NPDC004669 TaxID=3154555 RepID=UPI0033A2DDFF